MRRHFIQLVALALTVLLLGKASPKPISLATTNELLLKNCFPAIGFTMPDKIPSSLSDWWCDYSTEYAFMGFSYEISACM